MEGINSKTFVLRGNVTSSMVLKETLFQRFFFCITEDINIPLLRTALRAAGVFFGVMGGIFLNFDFAVSQNVCIFAGIKPD